jgi:hypothetical protein
MTPSPTPQLSERQKDVLDWLRLVGKATRATLSRHQVQERTMDALVRRGLVTAETVGYTHGRPVTTWRPADVEAQAGAPEAPRTLADVAEQDRRDLAARVPSPTPHARDLVREGDRVKFHADTVERNSYQLVGTVTDVAGVHVYVEVRWLTNPGRRLTGETAVTFRLPVELVEVLR